jgi:hypothetical protein
MIHDGLTVAQVTFTIILLAGAVSIESAFVHLMSVDRGYDVEGIATVSVSLGDTTRQGPAKDVAYFEQVLDRIRQLPGVRSASATEFLPLYATTFIGGGFGIDGHPANHAFANPVTRDDAMMIPIFSEYFQTMGTRILFGREFSDAEVRSGARLAVVDERFAREFGSPADAVGRQLTNPGAPPFVPVPAKIIGVVRQTEYDTDPAVENERQVFVPYKSVFFSATIVARVGGDAEDHLGIRQGYCNGYNAMFDFAALRRYILLAF